VSKRQKNIEKSTYGSELVTSSIATEPMLEVRFMLRLLCVVVHGPILMSGNNMSLALNI
jgi:hypothetical protein